MKKITVLVLIFLGIGLQSKEIEWDDLTFGGLRPFPEYSASQKEIMKLLAGEIKVLHTDMEKRLNFLSQNREISDGKFIKRAPAREQYDFPIKMIYVVNHEVTIDVAGGRDSFKITKVEFYTRKSKTMKHAQHPSTRIMRMKNDPSVEGFEGLKISMKKISPSGSEFREIGLEEIYEPYQRVRLAKIYKYRLQELINNIDKQIANVDFQTSADIRFIKNEMNTGGGYEGF